MATSSPTPPVTAAPATKPGGPDRAPGEPGSSRGITAVTPAKNPPPTEETDPPSEGAKGLPLPHERDQSIDMTDAQADPQVQQASRDLRRGLQDTGKSAPMDKAYDRLKR